MDLLPQGYGRLELLKYLELPEITEQSADWPLLMAGAANPIGHLRIKEASKQQKQHKQSGKMVTLHTHVYIHVGLICMHTDAHTLTSNKKGL